MAPVSHVLNVHSSDGWHFPSLHLSKPWVHFSQIMRHSLITLLFVLFFSCRSMFSWLPPVFIFMTGCATGMRPLTELRCVCPTMTGRESQAACGWALTPGGEERLCIATQLAFQLFGGLIRGLEERALWVSGLIKFINDELEWLTGGRSGRKFLFRKIFLDVLLIYIAHYSSLPSLPPASAIIHWVFSLLGEAWRKLLLIYILATRPASSEESFQIDHTAFVPRFFFFSSGF